MVLEAALSAGFSALGFYAPSGEATFMGLPVLSSLEELGLSKFGFAIGLGANVSREDEYARIKTVFPEALFPEIVHPSAWVSPYARISECTVLTSMASTGARSVIGAAALLNTGASVDHDSYLGVFGSLAPGARTGGGVNVGARSAIGMQAGVAHGVTIGDDVVVAAHSFVVADIPSEVVAIGVPAITVRARFRDDPYL